MKKLVLLLFALVLTGCSIFKTQESLITEPVLLKQSPFPTIPESLSDKDLDLYCEMLIGDDGKVVRAKLLTSSGDETWDYLAEASLIKWEFSPALLNGDPIEILVRRKIKLQYVEPQSITLAEILCNRQSEAESIYTELVKGKDFDEAAKKYSVSSTKDLGGYLGKVDIRYYCKEIRQVLSDLSEGEFTKPVTYGEYFVIFKRLKETKENIKVNLIF